MGHIVRQDTRSCAKYVVHTAGTPDWQTDLSAQKAQTDMVNGAVEEEGMC